MNQWKYHKYVFFVTAWGTVAHPNFICLYVCVCVWGCVCVFLCVPLLRCISPLIVMKLGGNVWTLVQLIVVTFHRNRFSDDIILTSLKWRHSWCFLHLCKGTEFCNKGLHWLAVAKGYGAFLSSGRCRVRIPSWATFYAALVLRKSLLTEVLTLLFPRRMHWSLRI